ncbi:MAG: transposase [Spirosomataceae bacterium]
MEFSSMSLGYAYFYTATILNWQQLLQTDTYKEMVMDSLKYLVDKDKIKVYGFVIMPNHIHLLWEMLAMNGKEMPYASLLKYTGHRFLKELRKNQPHLLPAFEVNTSTRTYNFWQRNSLPIVLYTDKVWRQKLDYIHHNPVQEKWQLTDYPENYRYSSAKFYMTGQDDFGILTHWNDS